MRSTNPGNKEEILIRKPEALELNGTDFAADQEKLKNNKKTQMDFMSSFQ